MATSLREDMIKFFMALFFLSAVSALAQPLIPPLPAPTIRTNYFIVRSQDDLGDTSWDSEEVFIANTNSVQWKIAWDASAGWTDINGEFHPITNYIVLWSLQSGSQTNLSRAVNTGTNTFLLWPIVRPPSNIVIRVSSQLTRTNPIDGPKFFAMFESSDLSHWKIANDASNTVSVSP